MEVIFRDIEKNYFAGEFFTGTIEESLDNEVISGVAALCSSIVSDRPLLEGQIKEWLSTGKGGSIQGVELRRALFAVFSDRQGEYTVGTRLCGTLLIFWTDTMMDLFTKSLENFGDKFYIKHTPMRIQEGSSNIFQRNLHRECCFY